MTPITPCFGRPIRKILLLRETSTIVYVPAGDFRERKFTITIMRNPSIPPESDPDYAVVAFCTDASVRPIILSTANVWSSAEEAAAKARYGFPVLLAGTGDPTTDFVSLLIEHGQATIIG